MENGEWRMENGERRMENGEWSMENGELQTRRVQRLVSIYYKLQTKCGQRLV